MKCHAACSRESRPRTSGANPQPRPRQQRGFTLNRVVGGYIKAFAGAANSAWPPSPISTSSCAHAGRMDASTGAAEGELEAAVLPQVEEALAKLNHMREEEGRGIEREPRRMQHIQKAVRGGAPPQRHPQNYVEKLRARMQELIGAQVDPSAFCRKPPCWSIAAIFRKNCRLQKHPALPRPRREGRDRQEARLPAARDESRGQHAASKTSAWPATR